MAKAEPEDLESILVDAFAPVPPPVRHHDLILSCLACGHRAAWVYPAFGMVSEARVFGTGLAGKRCACGVVWTGVESFAVSVVAVDPAERGYFYCGHCWQLLPLPLRVARPSGPSWCRGCAAVEAAMAEFNAAADEPWVVTFERSS